MKKVVSEQNIPDAIKLYLPKLLHFLQQTFIEDSLIYEYNGTDIGKLLASGTDIGKLLAVFCTRDSNGAACYSQLPENIFDMVSDDWFIWCQ